MAILKAVMLAQNNRALGISKYHLITCLNIRNMVKVTLREEDWITKLSLYLDLIIIAWIWCPTHLAINVKLRAKIQ